MVPNVASPSFKKENENVDRNTKKLQQDNTKANFSKGKLLRCICSIYKKVEREKRHNSSENVHKNSREKSGFRICKRNAKHSSSKG